MSQTEQQLHGKIGEDAAAAYYEKDGFRVVERNYRVSHKEIDLIVENDEFLVFVEVKARVQAYGARSRYGRPADAVNRKKRQLTVLAANAYLREHETHKQPRIDIVEVYLTKDPQTGEVRAERVMRYRNAVHGRA